MLLLGDRIRAVLLEKGMNQSQLAKRVGVKQQTISYICAQNSPSGTSRYSAKIAQILGVNPLWLQLGEGDRLDPMVEIDLSRVNPAITRSAITRLALLAPKEVMAHLEAGGKGELEKVLITDISVGPMAFAVELQGESMSPLCKEHDKVVIDPSLSPEPGDLVAASVDGVVLFRKYRQTTSTSFELIPINSDWPTIRPVEHEVKIIGVMAEHRSYRSAK